MTKQAIQKFFTAKRKIATTVILITSVALIIAACTAVIQSIQQPVTVTAGDTARSVMNIQWLATNFDRNQRLVVGVCMPKSWKGDDNTKMYMRSTVGEGTMSKIPSDQKEPYTGLPWKDAFLQKFGIGPNLLDDVEWVVFWTDQTYFVPNQTDPTGSVTINTKTGLNNLQYKPGYAFCENEDGLSDANPGYYANTWKECLEVVDGVGDLQDFCNPQIGIGEPSNATKDDIITFKYDGFVDTSSLHNETAIYFCSIAYLTDGTIIDKCEASADTKLILYETNKWRIDFWPATFYNLTPSQEIDRLEYYFMDASGNNKVGYSNTTEPFKYQFKCN